MELNNLLTINIDKKEIDGIKQYCQLNEINFDEFVVKCFKEGYKIEKYGLLETGTNDEITKEVIVEKPIEVIKEVVVEKPIEVIKEVVVEKEVFVTDDTEINKLLLKIDELENRPPIEVEKIVEVVKEVDNREKINLLQDTIQKLRNKNSEKDEKILQLEKNLLELKKTKEPIKAQFMGSSNLNDNLYK